MSQRHLKRLLVFVALVAVVGAREAQAAPTTFNDLTTFQNAAASASITLSVDNLDFLVDSGPFITITRPDFSVTDNDPPASMDQNNNSAFCAGGAQPTTGCITATTGANGFTFTFGDSINAFGLFVIKSPASNVPTLTLNDESITGSYQANGSLEIGFFGLIDDASPFTSVTLSGISAGNLLGFDDVNFGAAEPVTPSVPEPSSLALLLGGLSGLGAVVRRARARR